MDGAEETGAADHEQVAVGAGIVTDEQVAAVTTETAQLAWEIAAAIADAGLTASEWLEHMREAQGR